MTVRVREGRKNVPGTIISLFFILKCHNTVSLVMTMIPSRWGVGALLGTWWDVGFWLVWLSGVRVEACVGRGCLWAPLLHLDKRYGCCSGV